MPQPVPPTVPDAVSPVSPVTAPAPATPRRSPSTPSSAPEIPPAQNLRAEIRDFLTSRRARLTPDMVGLPTSARRRVPGLRREEVALLAGVSVDYYTRLERGNLAGASPEVLDALADALRLSEDERTHLADLAAACRPSGRRRAQARPAPARRRVRPGIQWMLDATSQPALVTDPLTTHVAANSLARALYAPLYDALPHSTGSVASQTPAPWSVSGSRTPPPPGADRSTRPGRASAHQAGSRPQRAGTQPNMARFIFLDERAQEFFPAWEQVAADTVAMLRLAVGRHRGDRALSGLIGELSTCSQDFARLWARHDVLYTCHGSKVIHHPEVGDIELAYEPAVMSTDPDLTVVLYAAEPGSPSADALRLLDSWSATLTSDRLAGQEAGQVSPSSGSVPASR